jgi:hypothetical protein
MSVPTLVLYSRDRVRGEQEEQQVRRWLERLPCLLQRLVEPVIAPYK